MRRSFKFLLRPTGKQAVALSEMLRDHSSLYNGALEERRGAYRQCGVTVKYGTQSAQLSEIRAFDPERQGRWSVSSQQATLCRLDKAFAAFFRRVTQAEFVCVVCGHSANADVVGALNVAYRAGLVLRETAPAA